MHFLAFLADHHADDEAGESSHEPENERQHEIDAVGEAPCRAGNFTPDGGDGVLSSLALEKEVRPLEHRYDSLP